jgi:hypothetical protein
MASIRGGSRVEDTETLVLALDQTVTVILCAEGFDPYLVIGGRSDGGPEFIIAENDNGGGGTGARIVMTSNLARRVVLHITTAADTGAPVGNAGWQLQVFPGNSGRGCGDLAPVPDALAPLRDSGRRHAAAQKVVTDTLNPA